MYSPKALHLRSGWAGIFSIFLAPNWEANRKCGLVTRVLKMFFEFRQIQIGFLPAQGWSKIKAVSRESWLFTFANPQYWT